VIGWTVIEPGLPLSEGRHGDGHESVPHRRGFEAHRTRAITRSPLIMQSVLIT